MTDREKLIGIVKSSLIKHIDKSCCLAENIVDDLLTEGVSTQPVAFSDNRRERMIELLSGYYEETGLACVHYFTDEESEMLADYILADGWMRPPCNVGDTVYCINTFFQNDPRINQCEVDALHITSGKNRIGHKKPSYALVRDINMHSLSSRIYFEKFGITAFLTREEAQIALQSYKKGTK